MTSEERIVANDYMERVNKIIDTYTYRFVSHGMSLKSFNNQSDKNVILETIQLDKKQLRNDIMNL